MARRYDIIIIGCGSAGLSVGLFMAKIKLSVLMVSKTDKDIGGDCLNDGCVPSKSLLHAARLARQARKATRFGLTVDGEIDMRQVMSYVHDRQEIIREHENAAFLQKMGIDVVLGEASFAAHDQIEVNGDLFWGRRIVIATGSRARKLQVPGVEKTRYFDNENIFHLDESFRRWLVIGAGPIGMEMTQAFHDLGFEVTVLDQAPTLLENDDSYITQVLLERMRDAGVNFIFDASLEKFLSPTEALLGHGGSDKTVLFDAVFVAIGRQLNIENLNLSKGGIEMNDGKIVVDEFLRTTNKHVFVCGDIAGDLQFSHAAEFHARILLNNFFSPFRKRLSNDHLSWVTYTNPEIATFGLNEKQLRKRGISYIRLEHAFDDEDRAVIDDYRYGRIVLFLSKKKFLRKQKILGGSMIAPGAGELIQELILANTEGLSVDVLFDKIYPYPVATRINQKVIVSHKEKGLTKKLISLLRFAFRVFG